MHTLVIPFFAQNVNLRPSLHVVGTPASTAISGFGHAALRLIAEISGHEFSDKGTALVIKSFNMLPGRSKARLALKGEAGKAKSGTEASMFDERLGLIAGHFVVRFNASASAIVSLEQHLPSLKDIFHTLGFSGGVLQVTSKLKLYKDDDQGLEALKTLPGHHRILVDSTQMIATYADFYGVDALDALAALLVLSQEQFKKKRKLQASPPPDEKAEESNEQAEQAEQAEKPEVDEDDTPYLGRLVPMSIGYRAIERPCHRNTGNAYEHVYAEPVTGLARVQAISSYIRSEEGFSAFWKHYNNNRAYISKGEI